MLSSSLQYFHFLRRLNQNVGTHRFWSVSGIEVGGWGCFQDVDRAHERLHNMSYDREYRPRTDIVAFPKSGLLSRCSLAYLLVVAKRVTGDPQHFESFLFI